MKADSGAAMGMMMDHAMMARMDSLDARLDSLTGVMTRATGTRKVNAMSAVVTALVAQHLGMRRMMHEHMMGMADMTAMSGPAGMMPMDGSSCTPAAKPDRAEPHDAQHEH